ncbi:MAG: TlpA family protein disulfide reductase [Neisseriaceae bacterium]|nr:TlpA family protein disulfide reductase [Neisseriaceae bacterium]MBP6862537.1 TlpA family protein disulfide reductase [Neisseriaceae bacterium]
MKKILLPLILIAVAALVWFAISSNKQQAPAFSLIDFNGHPVSEQQFAGKVTLVNFWATSCVGCVAEMPQLITTQAKYGGQGYQTIAIAMEYDPEDHIKEFLTKYDMSQFTVAKDKTGAVAKAYGNVQLTPTSVLVDSHGDIVTTIVGEPNFADLHQLIESELAKRA